MREHLVGAERMARGRRVPLDPLRAVARSLLLDELARYRKRGRFPLNHDLCTRARPEFIDSHGTRCAVAHLMDISGQSELVRHIAKFENHARVRELARLPEMRAWLAASGISLDEAARIQPSYCFVSQAEACFCNGSGYEAVGSGTVVAIEAGAVQVRVDRIEGDAQGVQVGDERHLVGVNSGNVGDQFLITPYMSDGSVLRIAPQLVVQGDSVRCQLNAETAKRPVTVDTAIEALLSSSSACVSVLETDHSGWNRSQCDGADDGGLGCGFALSGTSGAGLTTAALLVALISYRRRRQRAVR